MSTQSPPQAKVTVAASFPAHFFLENVAMRSDCSVLISVMNHKQIWYVPPVNGTLPVEASVLHTFPEPVLGIAEVEPDVFYINGGNLYTTHESYLHRLDLRGWKPGAPVNPDLVLTFPEYAKGLNGSCLVAPGVLLISDCFAGLIWRVDIPADGSKPVASVWLKHESMGYFPGELKPEQPGVNGIRYAERSHFLYYTATAKKLFMRVPVDPKTYQAAGEPELVVAGRMADDFCIDEDAGVIYMATHRQNTIDRVSMDIGKNSGFTQSVVGDPFTDQLIGPSGGVWGRSPGDYGHIAYFIMDGGTASPPPQGPQPAALLRVEF